MDELIVRVLRAVACFRRLRLLSCLVARGDLPLTQLARDVGMRRDVVCAHLARLLAAGLIQRRRSGGRCFYIARSPYDEPALSGQVMAWLREALGRAARTPAQRTGVPAPGRDSAQGAPSVHRAIFQAATAFTHPRRLQVLRGLASDKSLSVETLTKELRMSRPAAGRHLAKLIRRGYVESRREGRFPVYRLAPATGTSLEARLLAIVREHCAAVGAES